LDPASRSTRALGALLASIGVLLVLVSAPDYLRKSRSVEYAAADGRIVEFRIVRRGKSDELIIAYEYEALGVRYRNNIVGYGVGDPYSYRGPYERGDIVPVYFDPADPATSVLSTGVSPAYAAGILLGATLILLGALTILRRTRSWMETLWNSFFG
jgi:hypothetical protein